MTKARKGKPDKPPGKPPPQPEIPPPEPSTAVATPIGLLLTITKAVQNG